MSAQVLGRHGDTNRLGHLRGDAGIGRSVDERPALLADISALRRRIVVARHELASAQDPILGRVRRAQRALADERHEMDCVIEAIAAATDAQVALIRGVPGGPSVGSGHSRVGAERDPVALHEADAGWLRSERIRLSLKVELLERQVQLAAPAPATMASARDLALLEAMLVGALALIGEDHKRIRELALREADGRLAVARAQAEQIPVNGSSGPPLTPSVGGSAPSPPPRGADAQVATSEDPNLAEPRPGPLVVRSGELSPRPPDYPWDRATASHMGRRPNPSPDRAMSKPLLLDIVLPLIAVAIVLLVVLAWIG